jgi:hypothetical protein
MTQPSSRTVTFNSLKVSLSSSLYRQFIDGIRDEKKKSEESIYSMV